MKTDDVLKALACCGTRHDCSGCPMLGKRDCMTKLYVESMHVVERLKFENASLEAGRRADSESILSLNYELLHIRTKAIKEFAERLNNGRRRYYASDAFLRYIDRIVKEMTEERK